MDHSPRILCDTMGSIKLMRVFCLLQYFRYIWRCKWFAHILQASQWRASVHLSRRSVYVFVQEHLLHYYCLRHSKKILFIYPLFTVPRKTAFNSSTNWFDERLEWTPLACKLTAMQHRAVVSNGTARYLIARAA